MTRDEMVEWHHRLNGHELEQTQSWWWTGKPGMLQSMGSQRVGHDQATEMMSPAKHRMMRNKKILLFKTTKFWSGCYIAIGI